MKRFIIFLIIIFGNSDIIKAQNIKEVDFLANKLYQENHFTEAYKLYKRLIFFQDSLSEENYFRLGTCKENIGDSLGAIYYYRLASNIAENDSIKANYLIKIAKIYISQNNYSNSIYNLLIAQEIASSYQESRVNFLLGSSYFLKKDYLSSKQYFSKLILDSAKLHSYYKEINKSYPNPKTALWLSVFLPGLGQFYTGEIKEGFNSLLLNSALIGVYVYAIKESSFLAASISIAPWMHRYLQGGAEKAKRLAEKKRGFRNQKILNRMIGSVQNNVINKK